MTAGCGWTQCEGEPVVEIRAGDVIWCPPNHRHWHGATLTTAKTHIAIQEALDGKAVEWMEHVSNEQYRKQKERKGNPVRAGRRVVIDRFGPPEVMALINEALPQPAAGQMQVRHGAIGFNYIDVYQRRGDFPLPLPTGLAMEAAGVVETLGADVSGFAPGDHVVYMNAGLGAYADRRHVPADKLVKLPGPVSDEAAVALFFKGLTAQYLIRLTFAVKPGDLLLVHAAAGGVGQILARWATASGATVIGTTGSPRKKAAVLATGCAAAIDLTDPNGRRPF